MASERSAAQGFDDRAEPAQATPAGGVAKEVPHDGRASATPPPSAAQRCEIKTPDGKLQCELPAGHKGAHMNFGTNGTTAWGGVTRV